MSISCARTSGTRLSGVRRCLRVSSTGGTTGEGGSVHSQIRACMGTARGRRREKRGSGPCKGWAGTEFGMSRAVSTSRARHGHKFGVCICRIGHYFHFRRAIRRPQGSFALWLSAPPTRTTLSSQSHTTPELTASRQIGQKLPGFFISRKWRQTRKKCALGATSGKSSF